VGFLAQLAGQVAQPPADGGILHIAVEIQQQQDRWLLTGQQIEAVERHQRLAGTMALVVGQPLQATHEIPAQQRALA